MAHVLSFPRTNWPLTDRPPYYTCWYLRCNAFKLQASNMFSWQVQILSVLGPKQTWPGFIGLHFDFLVLLCSWGGRWVQKPQGTQGIWQRSTKPTWCFLCSSTMPELFYFWGTLFKPIVFKHAKLFDCQTQFLCMCRCRSLCPYLWHWTTAELLGSAFGP